MRHCALCKKGSKIVGSRRLLRGHYNPVHKSRKYPNLQWARVGGKPLDKARGGRMKICTQCLKGLHKKSR